MKKFTLLLSLLFLIVGINAQNPADFDPDFGTNGVAVTPIGVDFSMAYGMVVQPDGKIILGGAARLGTYKFAMVRYNTDGSLDPSFGNNGIVTTAIDKADYGKAIALQPDGRIILSGYAATPSYDYYAVVARYNNDGSIDNSFGTNGLSPLTIENTESVVLQADGKIVVAGFSSDNFAMARLNANGSLDTSYGANGYVITQMKDPDGSNTPSYVLELAVQNDGKILAAGFTYSYETYQDVAVARYLTDGTLDATFADAGIFRTDLGGWADFASTLDIQDDGRIVIGAHKEKISIPGIPAYDGAIIRLNTDGSYDQTFGENGVAYYDLAEHATYVTSVFVQDDGRILFTGQVVNYETQVWDIFVGRTKSNGTLDLSFGDNGVKQMDPFGTDDETTSIMMQEDGKILVGGYTNPLVDGPWNFMVIRLLGDDTPTEVPAVEVTFDNITSTTLDVTLTPNAVCASFYFVIMTPAEMQQWLPMFGTEAALIKSWGIHKTETYTHHFTGLTPDTEYYVYTVSVGYDGFEAPFDSAFVKTLSLGGTGEAIATIALSEITQTSVRMVVTPNSETALFHDGLISNAYFTEIGEEAAIELIKNNGWPLYATDDWVWLDLEINTAYKAISIAQNALGEWGAPTIVDFTTLLTSVNSTQTNPLVIFPNPSKGKFEIAGENIQGGNLRIIDVNGKEVYSAKIINKLTSIDISPVNSGLYIIEIEKDGVRSTSKFLKH